MMTMARSDSRNVLDHLTPAELTALRRLGDVVDVAPGSTIQPAGASSRWLYCVLEGSVGLSDGGPPEVAGPGACFPQEALDGTLAPTARSAVALTGARVLVLGLREFHGALDTIPGFARALEAVGA